MPGTEEEQKVPPGFDENSMFDFDPDKLEEQEEEEADDFATNFSTDETQPANASDEEEEEGEEEEEEDEDLFKDKDENEEEEEFSDEDVEDFNKRFNKDFQTAKELKDFLNREDKKDEKDPDDADELEQVQNVIDNITPLLDPKVTSDEDLLRRQFETIAVQKGKDLNNEDVQLELEDQIEELRDSGKMELEAYKLRVDLEKKVLTPHMEKKKEIEGRKQQKIEAEKTAALDQIKDGLAKIAGSDNFFGIKPSRKKITEIYNKIKNPDKYLEELKSDKESLAELAVMRAYKEEIFKKASGLTYSDGMAAVLEEFEGTKKKNSGATITKAQRSGTSAGTGGSNKGLLSDLTS